MSKKSNSIPMLLAALAVLVVIVVIVAVSNKNKSDSRSSVTSASSAKTASLKNGTYSASSNFSTPGGADSLDLSLTVTDGVVTSVTATTSANDNTSRSYDDRFLEAYKTVVVGKKVADLNLSRVAGASLTTQAFNNALQKIETEAQA